MAKATDISAPILMGNQGTENALTGIDLSSKAAFENALRSMGGDQAVQEFIDQNPEAFMTPAEQAKLEAVGPEQFWPGYSGSNLPAVSLGRAVGAINPEPVKQTPIVNEVNEPSTNVSVLKSLLIGRGLPVDLIDSSINFLQGLLKDGLDYPSAVEVFLASKEYTLKNGTKIQSPFYEKYGKFNEGLKEPYSPGTLFNVVEGYKGIVQKFNLNEKFASDDSISKYLKNRVTVTELDERANTARLKAITSDPMYVESLRQLGYINASQDLTDFFMDSNIGTQVLEQNRATAAFSAEALRRVGANTMIKFDKEFFTKMGAMYSERGLSEAQVSNVAQQGFANIAEQLRPTAKLAGIYEKTPETDTNVLQLQKELEAEQFLGMASQRRKKLAELESATFSGSSGTGGIRLTNTPSTSLRRQSTGLI